MPELIATPTALIWEAPDQSHCVYRVRTADTTATVTGPGDLLPGLRTGVEMRFLGEWAEHPKHGRQFRYATYTPSSPVDRRGLTVYLSAMCDGIGEVRASRLWDEFAERAVDVLRDTPERCVGERLLTEKVARAASEKLKKDQRFSAVKLELTTLLAGRGFQLSRVLAEAIGRWGIRAAHAIRTNPHRLLIAGISSAGWTRCDQMYLDLGHSPTRMKRQALAAEHVVHELRDRGSSSGSTWHDAGRVMDGVERLIGKDADPLRAVRLAVRAKRLALRRVGEERWVALAGDARDEREAAERAEALRGWMKGTARRRRAMA